MNKSINVIVESNIYFETIFYIENSDNKFDNDLLMKLTKEEQTLLKRMSEDKLYSHSEFIVHSSNKDFDSVISYILNLDIIEYAYYCKHERYPLDQLNIDNNEWESNRKIAINIIKKVRDFIDIEFNEDTYIEKINTIYKGFKDISPLNVAQSIMGKKFKRVSDYKHYYFIPLKYLSRPMRIFNDNELWTLVPVKPKVENLTLAQLERIMKVIGDSTRLKIIKLLSTDALYGKEIAEKLGYKAPTITHHINQLLEIGLLHVEQIAQIKYYSLNHNKYDAFIRALMNFKDRL